MTTHLLSRDDRGGSIEPDEDDEVEVRLPENAGTGFLWSVAALPAGVELADDRLEVQPGAYPGAAGVHRFRFTVTGPAQGELALELRRPWERLDRPEDRFTVRLTSRAGRGEETPAS